MNIALTLQNLLKINNISRSKLAREIGVHTSTVSNWIEGKDVTAENLEAVCNYFGCSLDYLAGKTNEKTPVLKVKESEKPQLSVEARADQILSGLSTDSTVMLDGKPASPEALEAFRNAVIVGVEMARSINKKKSAKKEEDD